MIDKSIPCPVCGTPIPIDLHQLIQGVRFACPHCDAAVGISPESSPLVSQAVEKLDKLKSKSCDHD